MTAPKRGEIWWADLPDPVGSGPDHRRPVLVVQTDSFSRSRLNTIVVVGVTSNVFLSAAPGNVRLSRRASGLPKDSVANVSQVITLDKSLLTAKAGRLLHTKLREVEDGLRLVLDL